MSKTLLLVEDEQIIALDQSIRLENLGYNVIISHSGEDALKLLQSNSIDLILMDIDLGRAMDGTEAAKKILELFEIPIVFLTSHSEKEMVEKVKRITRYGYLLKDSGDFVIESSIEMAFELFEAHKKTKDNEERLLTLINSMLDIVSFKDAEGRWLEANTFTQKLLNLDCLDYKGKDDFQLAQNNSFLHDTFLECANSDKIAWQKASEIRCDEIVPNPDGTFRIFDIIKVPTFNKDKSRKGLVIVGRDITERKKLEEKLKKALHRNKAQQQSIGKIAISDYVSEGNLEVGVKEITEIVANTLNIDRVGIWLFNDIEKQLQLLDLFSNSTKSHSEQQIIDYSDLSEGINSLVSSRTLVLDNALSDSPTKSLIDSYLKPNNIKSIMTSAIFGSGRYFGLITAETTVSFHHWEHDEISFILQVSDQLAILLLNREKKKSEIALMESEQRIRSMFENLPLGIFQVDENRKLVYINPAFYKMLKYDNAEEIIKKVNDSSLDEVLYASTSVKPNFVKETENGIGVWREYEVKYKCKDNSVIDVNFAYSKRYDSEKNKHYSYGYALNVTDRKKTEIQIKQLLNDKDLLIREVHHRVKNNMMTISSLLHLQSELLLNSPAYSVMKESTNRVNSMMLIYTKLYQSEDFRRVNMQSYIKDLFKSILASYNLRPASINFKVNIEDIILDSKYAFPIGIIVNELVSNSLKYAFPNGLNNAEISINLYQNNSEFQMSVKDNGIGIPNSLDYFNPSTFGLRLIKLFVTQLQGSYSVLNKNGTEFNFIFKI